MSKKAPEIEENVNLTEAELKYFASQRHALDYQFTEEQKKFLEVNGYIVIKKLFSKEICEQFIKEAFARAKAFGGLERDNPDTWKLEWTGILDVWHNPTYYKIRTDPKLYSIFAQLLRTHKLTVSLDRVCLKPPFYYETPGKEGRREFPELHKEFKIHTDMNLWDLSETKYQGSLALEDCPIGHGGFRCIPGFHKLDKIREYRKKYEAGEFHDGEKRTHPDFAKTFIWFSDQDLIKKETIEVPMEQGDFLVWSNRLPHANAINSTNKWRIQCYVRFVPDIPKYNKYRKEVAKCAKTGNKPAYYSTENSVSVKNQGLETDSHKLEQLDWLGERVLGLKHWDT
eukprot:TRINITY_DN2308_c0_g1_i1.p1 TRINITY_DN2308_c0_g1~~TRINITY_DN2308_c0_g1_i1.p1  ORF type:complete len:341 (+),score=64.33 TRINITY_DN2308_c0_g1_i1:55-1077(+)